VRRLLSKDSSYRTALPPKRESIIMNVIETANLTKHYGKFPAVAELFLNVKKGEIYGFLGLNGAGKTTTIRMLLGMIKPTAGTAYIFGKKANAGNYRLWEQVGYLVETPHAYPGLSVSENLEIVRRLRGLEDKNAVKNIIEKLELTQYKDRKTKNLSLVNAQRLGLAKALIHNPRVLILDEPTNGLDLAGIVEIRQLLLGMAQNENVTIFISSHILDEISRLANRIGIIHQGRLLQETATSEIKCLCQKRLVVKTADIEETKALLESKGYTVCVTADNNLELTGDKAITAPEGVATLLVNAGQPPLMLKLEEENLEHYFLRTIKKEGAST
jgi:ABC-2 type transport system ATP-binding protein